MDRTKFMTRENVDFSLYKTPWDGWYFKNGMMEGICTVKEMYLCLGKLE